MCLPSVSCKGLTMDSEESLFAKVNNKAKKGHDLNNNEQQ